MVYSSSLKQSSITMQYLQYNTSVSLASKNFLSERSKHTHTHTHKPRAAKSGEWLYFYFNWLTVSWVFWSATECSYGKAKPKEPQINNYSKRSTVKPLKLVQFLSTLGVLMMNIHIFLLQSKTHTIKQRKRITSENHI